MTKISFVTEETFKFHGNSIQLFVIVVLDFVEYELFFYLRKNMKNNTD